MDDANTGMITTMADPPAIANSDSQTDYSFARTNLYDILSKGTKALNQLANIADQSQHPRAYEVMALMIKNLGDVNDKIMNLQRDMRELEAIEHEKETPGDTHWHVSNGVFVGTTAELLDMAKQNKALNKP